MALAEKHPTDPNKYQSTFDKYGHGDGNGKSRNAVYKYAKKHGVKSPPKKKKQISSQKSENKVQKETGSQYPEQHDTKSAPVEEDSDFVLDESPNDTKWGSLSWGDDEEDLDDLVEATIPKPIADIAQGKSSEVSLEATGQFVRYGYMALDRMLTHWGRGVMNDSTYTLSRRPADYDALESATVAAMEHYGVYIPISPLLVLGATVGAAYGPPIVHIQKNRDPNRRSGFIRNTISKIGSRLIAPFKKGRKNKITQNRGDGEFDEEIDT